MLHPLGIPHLFEALGWKLIFYVLARFMADGAALRYELLAAQCITARWC